MPTRKKLTPEQRKYEQLCRAYVKGQPALIYDRLLGTERYARVTALGWVSDGGWNYACEIHVEEHGKTFVFVDRIRQYPEWPTLSRTIAIEGAVNPTHIGERKDASHLALYPLIPVEKKEK